MESAAAVLDPNGNELNDADASFILRQAIKSTILKSGGGKPILANDVIVNADRIAASHFRKPVAEYVLITSLSVPSLPSRRLRIDNCEVSALQKRGHRYPLVDALKVRRQDDLFAKHLNSTKYLTIKVRTSGRSVYEAVERGLDAVNLLRGLWTLFATLGSWTIRMGIRKQEAIGVIHTGPIHTLHTPDGLPAADAFWFEPDYNGDRDVFKPKDGWKEIEGLRRWAMRQIKRHAYRHDIEQLVMRYAVALDHANLGAAFLQMWGILERITDTVAANYDETVRRTACVYKDHEIARELLEHLRVRRNQYVHAGKSGEGPDQVAYLVKSFVDAHLLRLIRNDFRVTSLKEYGDFLALPTNIDTLEKRRDQLQRAIRIGKKRGQ